MGIFKKIKLNQRKYWFLLGTYPIALFAVYQTIDGFFFTKKADIPDKSKETTEYLNPNLPGAQIKGDGIDSKYESMLKSYGKIDDYSAVDNINRDDDEQKKEEYDSKYTDADLALLDQNAAADVAAMEQQRRMQERLQESAQKGTEMSRQGSSTDGQTEQQRQQATIDELNRALAQARLQGQMAGGAKDTTKLTGSVEGKVDVNERLVQSPDDKESQQVVKKIKQGSDYFHTLTANELDGNLIKAIIDEDIKAVDGSRVRLRLLADMAHYARQVWNSPTKIRNVGSKQHRMVMRLNNIYAVGDYFFIDFSIENKANIRFDIDEIRVKLSDKKLSKATNAQIVELTPALVLEQAKSFKYGYRNVIVLKKMTFPNDKVLTIEMTEKQISGRNISLSIDYEDVLQADAFDKKVAK